MLEGYVSAWPTTCPGDPLKGLAALPSVESVSDSELEVVFEGRADNRLWKDLAVGFVTGIPDGCGEFVGFYDRVARRMHPASGRA